MNAKITVTADSGESEQDTVKIAVKGDLEMGVRSTLSLFRVLHPDLPPFGLTIRIDNI